MRDLENSKLGVPVPKQRYRCQHVQAGYLTAARIDTDKGVIDVCQACYDEGYHSLKITDECPTTSL